jgi:hypothetical protein
MVKVVAKWDFWMHKVWLDISMEEVRANNRSQHCLNSLGYANLMKKVVIFECCSRVNVFLVVI